MKLKKASGDNLITMKTLKVFPGDITSSKIHNSMLYQEYPFLKHSKKFSKL